MEKLVDELGESHNDHLLWLSLKVKDDLFTVNYRYQSICWVLASISNILLYTKLWYLEDIIDINGFMVAFTLFLFWLYFFTDSWENIE